MIPEEQKSFISIFDTQIYTDWQFSQKNKIFRYVKTAAM